MTNLQTLPEQIDISDHDFNYFQFQENMYEVEYGYVIPGHFLEYGATPEEQYRATELFRRVAARVIHQFTESFVTTFQRTQPIKTVELDMIPQIYQEILVKALYGDNARYLKPSGTFTDNNPAVGRHFVSIRHFVEVGVGTKTAVDDWFVVSFGEITAVGEDYITKILIEKTEIGKY